jgi:hypothetical protein
VPPQQRRRPRPGHRAGRSLRAAALTTVALTLTGPAAYAAGPRPTPAPRPVVTRADHIAGQLAHDPVFITDEAPRDLTPDDATRIRAAVRRMPAPTYTAVVAEVDEQKDPEGTPERLIAILHDKLRRNGVYLVIPSTGIGITAEQFGVNLPLEPASREVTFSQPYNAGAARAIERFVDDIRSGQAQARYEKVYAKSRTGWDPKPYPEARDRGDLAQQAGVYSGMAVAVLAGAAVGLTRLRRRRRRSR